MPLLVQRYTFVSLVVLNSLGIAFPAFAQVTADGSLSTTVTATGNNFTITNGDQSGANLFHSFSQFSIPTGGSVNFQSPIDLANIFARITGGKASVINGQIKVSDANSSANVFLINPSGIQLGLNASLQVGGSFFVSTADRLLFPNGVEFNATSTNSSVLTVSQPTGLEFGQNPGTIEVIGIGHTLGGGPFAAPIDSSTTATQLQVSTGQTLALIGGNLSINGGILTASGGRIELGSVGGISNVGLTQDDKGFNADFSGTTNLGQIDMSQAALADVSGVIAGSIDVTAARLNMNDGSHLLVQNFGSQTAGDITITATEFFKANEIAKIPGTNSGFFTSSGATNETLGAGDTGAIIVSTPKLMLFNGGGLRTRNFLSTGRSGNVQVNASESIDLAGFSPKDPQASSNINTLMFFTSGDGGDIILTTPRLTLKDGAGINAGNILGTGKDGDLIVDSDTIEIIGFNPNVFFNSNLGASNIAPGPGGNIFVNTKQLTIRDGGVIDASTQGSGNAGNVIINASEFVDMQGFIPDLLTPSSINSSVNIANQAVQDALGLPRNPLGNGGNVTITTPRLRAAQTSEVTVRSAGLGNAGTLTINAGSVILEDGGSISASVVTGEGGIININASDFLLAQDDSFISAEAGGTLGGNIFLKVGNQIFLNSGSNITASATGSANGGNIAINTQFLTGIGNSDIIARAAQGRGGNIDIAAIGIFSLQFRDELTPLNDINASSDFGVSGTVNITNPALDAAAGLVELPTTLIDPSQQISASCDANQDSRFVATGRGGIPISPEARVTIDRPWQDIRPLTDLNAAVPVPDRALAKVPQPSEKPQLLEATGWQMNDQGQLALVANTPKVPTITHTPTCARSVTASAS